MLSFPVYRERHPRRPVSPSNAPEVSPSHTFPLFTTAHPVSLLAATLMELPASVANKRLTVILTPLDATLTKNWGRVFPTFRPSNLQTFQLCSRSLPKERFTTLLHSVSSTL